MNTEIEKTNAPVAVRDTITDEVIVRCPLTGKSFAATDVQGLIKSITAAAIGPTTNAYAQLGNIDEAPIEAVKELRKDIEEKDSALKDFDKDLKDALLNLSGFKAVVVQIKGTGARIDAMSVRGRLAKMYKALKAREDAEKFPDPTHSYALQFDVTDAGLKKIIAAVEKEAGKQYRVWHVEGEKAQIAANKFFASLGWAAAK